MHRLTFIKLGLVFSFAFTALFCALVQAQSPSSLELSKNLIKSEGIPSELKVSLEGKRPLPIAERAFLLSDLHQNDLLEIFQAPPCLDGEYYLAVQLYYDLGDLKTTVDWTTQIEVTLRYDSRNIWTKPLHVDMASQTFITTVFHDGLISCNDNYELVVKGKNITSEAPEENIYLKFLLFKHDDGVFDPATKLQLSATLADQETIVGWNYFGNNVLNYELEWVFIDAQDNFNGSREAAFKFSEPTRVSVLGQMFKHKINYPSGKVWYRVRAIGFNPKFPSHRILGHWFYSSDEAVAVPDPGSDINWRRETSFSDDGKCKNVMHYYDGTLRERQQQTNLSSENHSLVTEMLYDFEGRLAVTTLPAPSESSALNFISNFNVFNTTDTIVAKNTSSLRKKYHYDNDGKENSVLSTEQGAGNYYSSANTSYASVLRDNIPNASGYAYKQIEYSRDGRNSKIKQAEPGEAFRVDGHHVQRTYYGNANDEELTRLFGSNAGHSEYYRKNMFVDANGQAYITYNNKSGNIVATALAGPSPSNVTPLKSLQDVAMDPVTIDLKGSNKRIDGASKVSHTILNVAPNSTYTFHYDLSAYGSMLSEAGCASCSFDLKITITNPHGELVDLSSIPDNQSPDGSRYERNNIIASNCSNQSLVSAIKFTLALDEVGDYTITKTLVPHELTYSEIVKLVAQNSQVRDRIQKIREEQVDAALACRMCLPSGAQALVAMKEAIQETTDLECQDIYEAIVKSFQEKYPDLESERIAEDSIKAHPLYCKYQLALKNKASEIFEKEISQINSWNEAKNKGFDKLVDLDPFFNTEGLSGYSSKSVMQEQLNDILVATVSYDNNKDGVPDNHIEYRGTIDQITDPENRSFYFMPDGSKNKNTGFHLLYAGLLEGKSQVTNDVYQVELDKFRWALYRNYYLEAKRKTKLAIAEIQNCPSTMEELGKTDALSAKLLRNGSGAVKSINDSVTHKELEMVLANLEFSCSSTFAKEDVRSMASLLETYFNANTGNFLRTILRSDIEKDNSLIGVQGILHGYGCGLEAIAQDGPFICLNDIAPEMISHANVVADKESTESKLQTNARSVTENTPTDLKPATEGGSEQQNTTVSNTLVSTESQAASDNHANESSDNSSFEKNSGPNQIFSTVTEKSQSKVTALPDKTEFNALIALYKSTSGASWKNKTGWENAKQNSIENVSNWYGVTTNAEGHVIILNLESNNLVGHIPTEIGNLPFLQYLSFGTSEKGDANKLTGNIPATIGSLHSLRHLDLSHNQLQDAIPGELYNLKGIQHLDLSFNALNNSIANEITNLTSLNTLNLSHNQLSRAIPSALGNLSELQRLYLSYNKFYGTIPSSIGKLNKLQHLDLSNNNLNGAIPTSIAGMADVYYVRLNNNYLNNAIPTEIGSLTKLKELNLSVNRLSGSIPESIGNLKELQNLVLAGNQLEGAIPGSVGKLNNLSSISLNSNRLSGSIPNELFNLKDVQYIDLSVNQLSGTIPESIGNAKQIRKLFLSDNQITGTIPSSTGELANITDLSLHHNQLSGTFPAALCNLSKIESLQLSNNQLNGSIPVAIGRLTTLQQLVLGHNQLNDTIPSEIGNLIQLKRLDLASNKLSGSIPTEIGKLVHLSELTLDDNHLTGSLPNSLANLKNLSRVVLLNNDLEGTIPQTLVPTSGISDEAFWLSHNRFTFSNIQPLMNKVSSSSLFFSHQDSVDIEKIIPTTLNKSVTLATDIDRGVTPSCYYQWFKYVDGEHDSTLNLPSPDGYAYTIKSVASSHARDQYYYKITHPQIPSLILVSKPQRIMAFPATDLCSTFRTTREGISSFNFTIDWNLAFERCAANVAKEDSILKSYAIEKIIEKEVGNFYNRSHANCLKGVKESFDYTYVPKEYHYTLYYYDQAGNVVQMVPPQGVHVLSPQQIEAIKTGSTVYPNHDFVTRYSYNSLNKRLSQSSANRGMTTFLHNINGQLRLTQNGVDDDARYAYKKYDDFGRLIEQGEMTSKKPLRSLKNLLKDQHFPAGKSFSLNNVVRFNYDRPDRKTYHLFNQTHVDNRLASMESINDNDTIRTSYSYDIQGKTKVLWQQIPGSEIKQENYVYDRTSGVLRYIFYQYEKPDQFIQYHEYDGDNELKSISSSSDGFIWNREANYYYYKHGLLARTELGEYRVQRLDYSYTLQGWKKSLNMEGNSEGGPLTYSVGYFQNDYQPIGERFKRTQVENQLWTRFQENIQAEGAFNGNISWVAMSLPKTVRQGSAQEQNTQAALFQFDQLGRLVKTRSLINHNASGFAARSSAVQMYDENFAWDEGSNLTASSMMPEHGESLVNSTYVYDAENNRLVDNTSSLANLKYDEQGNLIENRKTGQRIAWTANGKVKQIQQGDSVIIEYEYDGNSNCVQKNIRKNGIIQKTQYVRDLKGNVIAIYNDTTAIEHMLYGANNQRLGSFLGNVEMGARSLGSRKYELTDYSENVVAVITDNVGKEGNKSWANVINISDYYSNGVNKKAKSMNLVSPYRYGINGLEKEKEASLLYNKNGNPQYIIENQQEVLKMK